MKKITLTLLLLLFAIVQFNAQSIVIGTGTDETTSIGSDPIDGYFNSFRYQVVYTVDELNAALTPFDEITALGWSISGDYAGGALLGYTIKMGHTSATNSSAHDASATVVVKNAFDYDPTITAAGAFDMIPFDTNFVWNGVENILVEICSDGQNPFTGPYGQVRTTAVPDGSRRYRVDGGTSCDVNTNTSNPNKPNIQFDYIDGVAPTDELDFFNLQFPATGSIALGGTFEVYAKAYEEGLTDVTSGQAPGILCWIGYSEADTDPSGSGWTWVPASFFSEEGNDDQYILDLGAAISFPGTYYYASRWNLNGGVFSYGGIQANESYGGQWGDDNNISGVLTVDNLANDECDGAVSLTVNTDFSCGTVTAGTTAGATASAQDDDVSGTPNNDVWFSFLSTNTAHRVSLTDVVAVVGTSTDMGIGVYDGTGGCSALVFNATSDPNTLNLSGLTVGSLYYVRVYGWGSGTGTAQANFNICVGTPPPPPANDVIAGATPIVPSAEGTGCTTFNFINSTANDGTTDSGLDGSCSTTDTGLDRFYSWTATTDALIWNDGAGNPGIVIRDAATQDEITCASTFAPDDTPLFGWTIGQDLIIQVYDFGTANADTSFCLEQFTLPTAPDCASNPVPVSGAIDIPVGAITLTWDAPTTGIAPTGYNLYAGTMSDGSDLALVGDFTDPSADVNVNGFNTTIYWQVRPVNGLAEATGCPIWNFTTISPPTGALCTDALVVGGLPFNTTGTTAGFGDDYSAANVTCSTSSYLGGDDIVYEYTPAVDQDVTVSLSNTATWVGVFIFEGCEAGPDVFTGCVANDTDLAGNPVIESASLVAGTTYYIVISTFPAPQSTPFTLDISVVCTADAGTITADEDTVILSGGTANISATPDGNSVVPTDYDVTYVLTSGTDLVIEDAAAAPSFEVTVAGDYTIHTLIAETSDSADPNYLDLSVVVFGTTTAADVLGIVGTNNLCAALDATGAPITVLEECTADAGTITADATPVSLSGGTATISATPDGNSVVPTDYDVTYVLTSGIDLVIEDAGAAPSFEVTAAGDYTIHTLIAETSDSADPNYLDLSVVVFGTTTAADVLGIVGTNNLCAALDATGAPITVLEECTADAGTITADASPVSLPTGGTATISATPDGNSVVPTDYDVTYVLTSGTDLVIEDAGATPSFDVTAAGDYTIHTLIAETSDNTDPNYLDLSVIVFGTTTAADVLGIVGTNNLCAALDATGAPIVVEPALSVDDQNKLAFTYFPNPVKNELTLKAQSNIQNIAVYNMLGQEVLNSYPNTLESNVQMDKLQSGAYFIKVTINNATETIRVVRQ